ncbi:hypothetical protein TNCV_4701891 [Trichonephila clavipes]|uniref:Uncharacterized protein n=1 Tax=Trichonephila clavipes TaxID=2585209 RepID=A0A8X6WGS9_TRICX|nr:hypothetical protein TNCV_4701891 [Trichonephila clavipes]
MGHFLLAWKFCPAVPRGTPTRKTFEPPDRGRRNQILIPVPCEIQQQSLDIFKAEPVPELDEIVNVTEEVADLARQINLEVKNNDVQELLDSHNQELAMDELIEIHEQEQDIEELESLDQVQSEDRMTVGNLTKGVNLIENGLHTHTHKF